MLLCTACSQESVGELSTIESISVPEFEAQLLVKVNEHRASLGLSPLQNNAAAYQEASSHNDYMIGRGNISHDNFEQRASRIVLETFAKEVGENVAWNHATVNLALEGWLKSPPHKSTLEGAYTHTAISIKKDSNGTLYYTQIFIQQ